MIPPATLLPDAAMADARARTRPATAPADTNADAWWCLECQTHRVVAEFDLCPVCADVAKPRPSVRRPSRYLFGGIA